MIRALMLTEVPVVLPLLKRCVRMTELRLRELLAGQPLQGAWVAGDGPLLAVAMVTSDGADGHTIYFARDLRHGDLTVLDSLLAQAISLLVQKPAGPVTAVLDGFDPQAADYFSRRGYRQIDCDYLMSVTGSTPTVTLTIRSYQSDELGWYISAFDQAFLPLRTANGREPFALWSARPEWAEEWFASAAVQGNMASVWDGDQLVGCYRLDGDTIDSIAVLPAMQNRGYGTQIIRHCIALLRQRGYTQVYLYVADCNTKAKRLYERLGFEVVSLSRYMVKR